jgi:hypothetical protein
MTRIAEGINLKDGSNVLAKLAPAHTDGSLCLEREAHMFVPLSLSRFPLMFPCVDLVV